MKIFIFIFLLIIYTPSFSATSQKCPTNSTDCNTHGKCMNGNCLCDLYYYGDYCEQEMNTSSKATFVETGVTQDIIPLLVTVFIFGLPILFGSGLLCLNKIFPSKQSSFINPQPIATPLVNLDHNEIEHPNNELVEHESPKESEINNLELYNNGNTSKNLDSIFKSIKDSEKEATSAKENPKSLIQSQDFSKRKVPSNVKNANIKKNVGFVEDHSHIELMNGNTSKDLDFIFENIKESTNNKTVNDSPLKPITFPKRHLPPLPPVSVQNDFKFDLKKKLENTRLDEENSNLLDLLDIKKLQSFKQKEQVIAFYSSEAEKFVLENDKIPDIISFLEKNLEKTLLHSKGSLK